MADFDDKSAGTELQAGAASAVSASKSSLRRKVVGKGQTSLSSPSPMILPDTIGAAPAALPPVSAAKPVASATVEPVQPASVEPAPVATPAPVSAPEPAPAPLDSSAPIEAAPKRPVGRPRKVAVGTTAVGAKANAVKPALAQRALAKPSLAKPIVAKPIVAKPHPIEPNIKPAMTKTPRIKAAAVPPAMASAALGDAPAGKVAASVAAAARPALRAARIINSVSTPDQISPSSISIKDLTMDMSANFNGFQGAMSEAQAKAQAAFEKSSNMMGEAGEFAKGNVEAMVESSKIFAEGMQQIGSTLVAEGRTAFESMTGDIKELAAVKSPSDFVKLQSELVRKNFDSAVSYSSKSSETFLKLMSDAFAPLSGRVSLAVEKTRQVVPMSAPTNIAA